MDVLVTAVPAAVIDGVAAALAVVVAAALVATAVAADSGCYGYSCISSSSD